MRIAVVVLHYENLTDTTECLESLAKYLQDKQNQIDIVVVDNGSVNEKAAELKERFPDQRIHFINSESNLGFARGNNIGFQYAKHTLQSEIIVLANNDLIFEQNEFFDRAAEVVVKQRLDIAGPRIISMVDKKNQNPVPYSYPNLSSVNERIIKYEILRVLCYFGLDICAQSAFSKRHTADFENDVYQLHGACLILANRYVKNYEGLYPGTFMYMEEDILKFISKKDKLNMKYLDDIEVFHKEGSSTEKLYGAGKKKRLFFYKWSLDSCKQLKHLMKSEDIDAVNR